MFRVLDSTGHQVGRRFSTYKDAFTFLIMSQRYDWKIVS